MGKDLPDNTFRRLCDQIDLLIERYPDSAEALEQVKWWAQEENIPAINE